MGALLGVRALPAGWLEVVELRDEIEAPATDLAEGFRHDSGWSERYPPD